MSAAIIAIRTRAIDVLRRAVVEVRQHPGSILIVDSASGAAQAWPRGVALPPGWYRLCCGIKGPSSCAA